MVNFSDKAKELLTKEFPNPFTKPNYYYSFYIDKSVDAFERWKILQNKLRPLLETYSLHTLQEVKSKTEYIYKIPMFGYDEVELITIVLKLKSTIPLQEPSAELGVICINPYLPKGCETELEAKEKYGC